MKVKKFFLIIFLCIALAYVTNLSSIPNKIILFQDEELELGTMFGIYLHEKEQEIIETSTTSEKSEVIEHKTIALSLFNVVEVKEVNVTTIPNSKVIPLGNTIGLKLYSSGVLVIGMTEIEGKKPYENSGIEEGDLITYVNDTRILTTDELTQCVNTCEGKEIQIKYIREGQEYITNIEPIKTSNKEYKLGLWVRDGAAGIGTITYYEPSTNKFAALGHGIEDADTEELISISKGELVTTEIASIVKGEEGTPGEIRGTINSDEMAGTISANTEFGIYGTLTNSTVLNINLKNEYQVALREEIKEGAATVILTLEDGIRKEYDIEIEKIYLNNNDDNKSMLIKIIDDDLLNLTGGIIQGMSGAPIIQNGKFIRSNYSCTN